jgi:hypothetical protein
LAQKLDENELLTFKELLMANSIQMDEGHGFCCLFGGFAFDNCANSVDGIWATLAGKASDQSDIPHGLPSCFFARLLFRLFDTEVLHSISGFCFRDWGYKKTPIIATSHFVHVGLTAL